MAEQPPPDQPADVGDVANQLFNHLQGRLEDLLDLRVSEKAEVKPPQLKSAGFQKQAELNAKVLTALQPIKTHQDPKVADAVKRAMSLLEERNADLVLAESCPDGFKFVDKLQAVRSLTGSAESQQLVALSSLLQASSSRDSRKRARSRSPPPSRPFRQRGSDVRHSESRFSPAYFDLVRENERLRAASSTYPGAYQSFARPGPPPSRCHSCFEFGHWSRNCPAKQQRRN